ncbi:SH2B adapter protein 2-like isoform X1 [Carcharodon carcharias]|uniref:SH2B adapter protein 2-like isoform X1 n=1 Tax=Carcharodon carcharias TaxID=13397 RepID=UPI001B7F5CB3|nr:SH2B adapter protein 2-like isoform X1 [Carcharodon carcharias]XP_041052476.1 SH2B adapter protein 2-like isoform X1 [Carcharodon carcharias]
MNGDSESQDSLQQVPDWREFCEVQARAAATEFAKKFRIFISENPHYECPGIETTFSQHFASHFVEYFALEVNRPYLSDSPTKYNIAPFSDIQNCQLPYSKETLQRKEKNSDSLESIDNTSNSSRYLRQAQVWNMSNFGHSRSSEDVSGRPKFKKGFSLRNMSMCMVDGMKEILQWRSSAEPLLDAGQSRRPEGEDFSGDKLESEVHDKWSHKLERLRLTRSSSAKVELLDIQREGMLRYMVADDTNCMSSTQWQKCRLLLRKAVRLEGERFLLEFYVPPKSTKPRVSIPLSAIIKVRTTMPLEMPDKDNTFVLKVENGAEYILETIDSLQKHSWVADIQDCMDPGDSEEDLELISCPRAVSMPSRELPSVPPCSCDFLSDGVTQGPDKICINPDSAVTVSHVKPKELQVPEPLAHIPLENFLQTLHSETPSTASSADEKDQTEAEPQLSSYPWFHGTLSRVKAAQLVLAGGSRSHGLFVIRQSETRPGEYVLTFNFQGKAKHLRLSLNETGQCHVQHLWFQTILDMLKHFHTHPIPLESGGSADITLRSYVLVTQPIPEMNTSHNATPPAAPTQPSSRSDTHQSQHYFANSVAGSLQSAAQVEGTSPSTHPAHHRSEAAIAIRTNISERLLQPQAATSEDYHDSDGSRNRARAVENQYSFY